MRAVDVMTAKVATVSSSTNVREIARLMLDHGVSGVPVTDTEGRVLGMVSEGDLMRRTELGTERHRSWWLKALTDDATLAGEYVKTHGMTAQDVMSTPVIMVAPDTPLDEIVSLMERHRIKRTPVVRDGKLVGIVSRANLLRAFASIEPKVDSGDVDRVIRAALLETLKGQTWAAIADNGVVVTEGVVHIWGIVGSEEERRALRIAAERVPGVRAVEDHTALQSIALPFGA